MAKSDTTLLWFLSLTMRMNLWVGYNCFSLYVRRTSHHVKGKMALCFDIANVENKCKAERGQGKFWDLIATIEAALAESKVEYLLVESVQNDRLAASLPLHGFQLLEQSCPPTFFKKLK